MISFKEGYKRKPGTKPCAEGSCVKEEVSSAEKHHAMVFGRMNPVTTGHEAVVNKLHSVAKEHNAGHSLVVSHSQDAKKNPLSSEQKVKHAKNAFPDTNVSSSSKEKPTILHHAAELHKQGVTHLHVVAGSDRHKDMHELLHKYNGKDEKHGHYNFKKITVHSSGERDPDSEGTEGMSASKMREHAAAGNKAEFHKGAPSKMKPEHKDAMYNDVRKGMNIKESLEEAHKIGDKVVIHKGPKDVVGKVGHVGEIRKRYAGDTKTYTIDHDAGSIQLKPSHFKSVKEETTPYWKKSSFNKRMSKMAKQERLERERKEAEKKPVKEHIEKVAGGYEVESEHGNKNLGKSTTLAGAKKRLKQVEYFKHMGEETLDQQDDRAKQLKRFKDQMSKLNGPNKDTEIALDKKEKEAMNQVQEVLRPEMGAGTYINDFIKSTNPRFNNKSKEERRKMAIGAYMAAKAKGVKEETELDEARGSADKHWSIAQDHKEKASLATKGTEKYHAHMADHHDSMSRYHDQLGQSSHAEAHADKAEIHHEKAYEASKSVKEGTIQTSGDDSISTSTSAPSASTAKDTGMAKKIKGFKFFNGENDKQMNMNQPVKEEKVEEGYQSHSGRSHGNPYGGGGFGKREREDDEGYDNEPHYKPVAPVPARKYIKGTPENKAAKAANKPINGHPTNEQVEAIDEKSEQAKRNKTMKNMMDASRGARFKVQNKLTGDAVRDWDNKHPTARAQNVAIGRALRNESMTGNPGKGYHGACGTADEKYEEMHKHVKNLTDGDDKTVKHYLDSGHGEKLAGREQDHDHIKTDFKKFMKYYRPEMHKPQAGVNVDKVNSADQKPHDEKFETVKKTKVKEETMKSYKEFLQSLDEVKMADLPSRKIQGKSYGANYVDPEGADETKDDMKKPEKKAAGRKTGQSVGSYKRRQPKSAC